MIDHCQTVTSGHGTTMGSFENPAKFEMIGGFSSNPMTNTLAANCCRFALVHNTTPSLMISREISSGDDDEDDNDENEEEDDDAEDDDDDDEFEYDEFDANNREPISEASQESDNETRQHIRPNTIIMEPTESDFQTNTARMNDVGGTGSFLPIMPSTLSSSDGVFGKESVYGFNFNIKRTAISQLNGHHQPGNFGNHSRPLEDHQYLTPQRSHFSMFNRSHQSPGFTGTYLDDDSGSNSTRSINDNTIESETFFHEKRRYHLVPFANGFPSNSIGNSFNGNHLPHSIGDSDAESVKNAETLSRTSSIGFINARESPPEKMINPSDQCHNDQKCSSITEIIRSGGSSLFSLPPSSASTGQHTTLMQSSIINQSNHFHHHYHHYHYYCPNLSHQPYSSHQHPPFLSTNPAPHRLHHLQQQPSSQHQQPARGTVPGSIVLWNLIVTTNDAPYAFNVAVTGSNYNAANFNHINNSSSLTPSTSKPSLFAESQTSCENSDDVSNGNSWKKHTKTEGPERFKSSGLNRNQSIFCFNKRKVLTEQSNFNFDCKRFTELSSNMNFTANAIANHETDKITDSLIPNHLTSHFEHKGEHTR